MGIEELPNTIGKNIYTDAVNTKKNEQVEKVSNSIGENYNSDTLSTKKDKRQKPLVKSNERVNLKLRTLYYPKEQTINNENVDMIENEVVCY